jgi:hypothetical protein
MVDDMLKQALGIFGDDQQDQPESLLDSRPENKDFRFSKN